MDWMDSETYLSDIDMCIESTVGLEQLTGSTVIVTGATGTIGSYVADVLLRFGKAKVIVVGRNLIHLQERFGRFASSNLSYAEYDFMKPVSWKFNADYIIHSAGLSSPSAYDTNPVETLMGNVIGIYNLLEYGRTHNVKRVLYVSSGEVYGQGDTSLDAFDEAYSGYVDPISPRSCYPNGKRAAETLCAAYSKQYGIEAVIVRPGHIYGPGMTTTDNRAHAQFLRNALKREDIVLKSAGKQMRSYCYAGDCASALLTALINGRSSEAYNIANPQARVTVAEFANIVADVGGCKVVFENPVEQDKAGWTPITKQVLDTKKIEALGWKGYFSVELGVAHTLCILRDMEEEKLCLVS